MQRPQPYLGRPQVGDLIDLEDGVDVVGALQDLLHLVGGDGIQPATEAVQLNDVQVGFGTHLRRRLVEPSVVAPLVAHPKRTRQPRGRHAVGQRVLTQHHHAQRVDHLGDAVVDLGVDVVWTTGQHDAAHLVLAHVLQGPITLGLDVDRDLVEFFEAGRDRSLGLGEADMPVSEDLHQPLGKLLGLVEAEVRVEEADTFLAHPVDVLGQHLRIERHNRAVVIVVGVGELLTLVVDARHEDRLDALVDQPFQVPVGELGRIADVLGRDGLHAGLEQLMRAAPRDDDLEAELGEDGEPKRIVLVHAQGPRDTDLAAGGSGVGEPAVAEDALVLVVVEVGHLGLLRLGLQGRAAVTAVAGDQPGAVVEVGDGELAMVLAELADALRAGHLEVVEIALHQGRDRARFVMHPRSQRGTVGTHQAGDIGTHHVDAGLQLEGPQHRVVEEGAALDDHLVAEFAGVAHLHHLVERVSHHRVAQPGRDVADRGALFLGLLDRGVHEDGAAAAEVDRRLRGQPDLGEAANVGTHRRSEGLQERAAT